MKKKLFAFAIFMALSLSLSACGSSAVAKTEAPVAEPQVTETVGTPVEDNGQNSPVTDSTDYSGVYQETNSGRGEMHISGSPDHYDISVDWSFNPGENTTWTFSGTFDSDGVLNFSDCFKVTTAYYENGEVQDATTEYSWATGSLSTDGNGGFVWSIPQDSSISGSIFR
ncbi:MAG: hypothetical protein IJV40_08760 [Oscillospiraceae bacterium]|nr:hypothetical protein [Oscillospiraceae bacterium]